MRVAASFTMTLVSVSATTFLFWGYAADGEPGALVGAIVCGALALVWGNVFVRERRKT